MKSKTTPSAKKSVAKTAKPVAKKAATKKPAAKVAPPAKKAAKPATKPAPAKPAPSPAKAPKAATMQAKAAPVAPPSFATTLAATTLTSNEQTVLRSLATTAADSGFDFCYADDARLANVKALPGVIASLIKKNLVTHTRNEFGQCYVGDPADSTEHKTNCELVLSLVPAAATAEPVEAPAKAKAPSQEYTAKTDPTSRYHNPDRSAIEGPVALMRGLCEKHYPKKTRKEIIAMGMDKGVTKNTAMAQFAMWKARKIKEGTLPTLPDKK